MNRGLSTAQNHAVSEQLLAKALCGSGALALRQNDFARARVRFGQCLTLWQQLNDVSNVGLAQFYLGALDLLSGNLEGAASHYEGALDLLRQAGDKWEIGSVLGNMGFASLFRGDLPRAQVQLHDGFTLLQQVGEQVFSGVILFGIAYIQFLQGEGGRARIDMQEGLRLVNEMGEKPFFVYGMIMLANVLVAQEPTRAVRLFGAAMKLSALFGAPLPPLVQTMADQIVDTASAQIDPSTFSASREEGHAMNLEQAVAFALEVK